MADIQVAIEGEDAVSATEELLQISGISGSYVTPTETEREGTAATIATIVGIVGGGQWRSPNKFVSGISNTSSTSLVKKSPRC